MKKTKLKYDKNVDSLGIVHDDNTEFRIFDQLLFEVMLMDIRSVTISYSTFKKKKKKKKKKREKNEHNREESLIKDTELLEKIIREKMTMD